MKHLIKLRYLCILALVIPATSQTIFVGTQPKLTPILIASAEQMVADADCLGTKEISTTLQLISSSQSAAEQQIAQSRLIDDGKRSTSCRKRIVSALIAAMDRPGLDLSQDRSSFYLWHYGSEVLASLQAEESVDFLIKHFELNDGTYFTLNHHPAVVNVIRMGPRALPRLKLALDQSSDPNVRQYSVFCIASIGGPEARTALEQAFIYESNECIRGFLAASLDAFKKSSTQNQIAPDSRTDWYASFLCNTP
jgi:hypothetical protein